LRLRVQHAYRGTCRNKQINCLDCKKWQPELIGKLMCARLAQSCGALTYLRGLVACRSPRGMLASMS